jgi:hypothetical protein
VRRWKDDLVVLVYPFGNVTGASWMRIDPSGEVIDIVFLQMDMLKDIGTDLHYCTRWDTRGTSDIHISQPAIFGLQRLND